MTSALCQVSDDKRLVSSVCQLQVFLAFDIRHLPEVTASVSRQVFQGKCRKASVSRQVFQGKCVMVSEQECCGK